MAERVARLAKRVGGLLNSVTLDVAPCSRCGAFFALLRHPLGLGVTAFVPVGPVSILPGSGWGMRWSLEQLRQWHRDERIGDEDYQKLRAKAPAWFTGKGFGR